MKTTMKQLLESRYDIEKSLLLCKALEDFFSITEGHSPVR